MAATNKIIAQLAIPYIIDRKPIRMKAAIGMAVYSVDGKRYDDLLQAADFAIGLARIQFRNLLQQIAASFAASAFLRVASVSLRAVAASARVRAASL